jgi:hypothetical protein
MGLSFLLRSFFMHFESKRRAAAMAWVTALPAAGLLACSSEPNDHAVTPDASPPDVMVDVQEPDVHPSVQVTMNGYTQGGSGANTQETYLNVSNVNASKFGKLFTRTVDGDQYAQPLYMSGLKMPVDGKVHNVVFLATAHDSVYAYDADDATATAPLWQKSLGTSTPEQSPYLDWQWSAWANGAKALCPSGYSMNEVGITATPVIDPATDTIYVVALNVVQTSNPGGTCFDPTMCPTGPNPSPTPPTVPCNAYTVTYQLHALDLFTGDEKFGGPVDVTGTAQGSGAASQAGNESFDAGIGLVRTGLLLVDQGGNKTVYVTAASFVDQGPYHGWIFGYDAGTLKQTGVFNDTPNGIGGGIWQSGRGPIADKAGNVYVVTGNGTFDVGTGMGSGDDYGDTVLKFNADAARGLSSVGDYFTQFLSDYQMNNLPNDWDDDLGSAGATLIPNTTMMLVTGKLGMSYLLDTNNLGKWSATADNVVQKLRMTWRSTKTTCTDGVIESWVYGTPITWVGPDGTHVYVWADADYLREFLLDANGLLQDSGMLCWCNPWVVSSTLTVDVSDPNCASPHSQGGVAGGPLSIGGALAVSSNGTAEGSGILWATYPSNSTVDAMHGNAPGTLAAYDASNVTDPIWTSTKSSADALGNWAKFTPPTIANGKVYTPTFSKQLVVYGALAQ